MQKLKFALAGALTLSLLVVACGGGNSSSGDQFTPPVLSVSDAPGQFTLQVLHFADADGNDNTTLNSLPNFSGLVARFRSEAPNNTLVVSSGDNVIPGPRFSSAEDSSFEPILQSVRGVSTLKASAGRFDIAVLDALGTQASAIGNHEFDLGPREFRNYFRADGNNWNGGQFPYLSANANLAGDSDISGMAIAGGNTAMDSKGRVSPWVVQTVGSERVAIVGASSPTFPKITSVGGVTFAGGNAQNDVDIAALTSSIQAAVDQATNAGINKVVLLAHMQQIDVERELATRLRDVDIIVAGGSNTRLGNFRPRAGESFAGRYPELINSPTNIVALVNVDGDYKYLGRLIVTFDQNGRILADSINRSISNAYATSETDLQASNVTPLSSVVQLTSAVKDVISRKDGAVFGATSVFLEGRRALVRTQETNLGNLTADANLAYARLFDPSVQISLKNGGGIRAEIGTVITPAGSTTSTLSPPVGNPATSPARQTGQISQLAIENSLRFNNDLTVVTVTATELKDLLEHAVAATTATATPGQFPQVGGMSFSYDPAGTARTTSGTGSRIRTVKVGNQVVVQNGTVTQQAASTSFKLVTLNFLVGSTNPMVPNALGGDSYPFTDAQRAGRIDLSTAPAPAGFGVTLSSKGKEQDALALFLKGNHSQVAFAQPETDRAGDLRIQNLAFRQDTVASQ